VALPSIMEFIQIWAGIGTLLDFLISKFSAKKTKKGGWREVIGLVLPLCL
jgi:hypothetical protein